MSDKDKGQAAVYNILAFNFAGQDTAKQMFKEARSAGAFEGYDIVVEAIVEQDEKGKAHFQEPGHGVWGAVGGGAVGGLLSLIGGPVGLLAWAVGGAVVGGAAGKYLGRPIKKGDLKEIGAAMSPDTSAILLLLEDIDTKAAVKSMSGYNANVVTLTVGDELSGQIASYMAAEVTADQGDAATEEIGVGS
ncbi:MAG: DUF1269 domain-containing protein [Candidatus Promineifilaceae bacterium]